MTRPGVRVTWMDAPRGLLLPAVNVLILMADINDRLERLNKLDELSRRVRAQRSLPDSVAELGEDFVEVVEAVVQVVRRQPGAAVMVAPGDGRHGSSVVRIAEAAGEVEITVMRPGAD
jgi:hypothetical protein